MCSAAKGQVFVVPATVAVLDHHHFDAFTAACHQTGMQQAANAASALPWHVNV